MGVMCGFRYPTMHIDIVIELAVPMTPCNTLFCLDRFTYTGNYGYESIYQQL